jgi:hypothetical protein
MLSTLSNDALQASFADVLEFAAVVVVIVVVEVLIELEVISAFSI